MSPFSRIALTLALSACAVAARATVVLGGSDTIPPLLVKAADAANRDDCATALRLIATELGDPKAADLPANLRVGAYEIGASCAARTNKTDLAYHYAFEGTKSGQASDMLWRLRLGLEASAGQLDAALTTTEAMANGHAAALNALPVDWFFSLDRSLRDKHDDASRRRLLAILTGPAYQPNEVIAGVDLFRQSYAGLLYDAGDKDAAAALVKQIELPSVLNLLSLDPRFRAMLPADFAARAAVERYLAHLRAITPDHPDSLRLIIEIAEQQRKLGRAEEALATLEGARPIGPNAKSYADLDDRLNWWWNAIARAHQSLGHYDDMVAALRQGANAKENGDINVTQIINLAGDQLRFGHYQDALATLAVFTDSGRPVSPFGAMEIRLVRGCSARLAGQSGDADIAFARAHASDNAGALTELLLCTGDLDGAAATLVRRLDDPQQLAAALLQLSDFDPPKVDLPPDPIFNRIPALKARPDIQAAIARAGDIRRFDLRRDDL